MVDVKNDYVQTFVQRHDRLEHARVEEHFRDLEALARAALRAEGLADHEIRVGRSADLRYFGQAWEVRVELPPGPLDERSAAEAVERFHAAHEQRFGYAYRQAAGARATGRQVVEWVNVRATGIGPIERPKLIELPPGDGRIERARRGTRAVMFDGVSHDCALYDRTRLASGDLLAGPAIVEEFGSTTVVFPGLVAEVDRFGNLVLTRKKI